jgi:ketosteroid isomerase-like protein
MRKPAYTLTLIVLTIAVAMALAVAADTAADLKKADSNWNAAAQSKNVDQFMSFIGDNADISGPDGKWLHGKDAIRTEWSKMLADPNFKLSWTADSAEASRDGSLGYTRGTWQGSEAGKPISGTYATVWKKQKGGKWLVAVDIASSAPPQQ